MADQSITCTGCGKRIPLTRALRADIEESVRQHFDQQLAARERELQRQFEAERVRVQDRAAEEAGRKLALELETMQVQLREQARELADARQQELRLRQRERELERQQVDLEIAVARKMDDERKRIVEDVESRFAEARRLKDAEKERQLSELRRQIDDLRRKAEQGSQQSQGECGEQALETLLRDACRADDIQPVSQGIRGADLHHVVFDGRGQRAGAILWECKNTRHWSDAWIAKLKVDQRAIGADVAILVTASLPKGVTRLACIDGVLVTDFGTASGVAAIVRVQLLALAHARHSALHKEAKLELLHRYLTGTDFRHRVEAVVEAFAAMRHDLDQERRTAERQWARRARQLDAVTMNMAGMYGDLQGLVPALPTLHALELPGAEEDVA